MKKKYFVLLLFVYSTIAFAGTPAWTINPGSFQYSMTVTAVLNSNCQELNNTNNKLGAFVHDTCRGVAITSTLLNGRRLAYLIVYSNLSFGDTVKFKYYDSVADTVYTSKVSVLFGDNGSFGSNISPFVIKNNDAPTSISLSLTSVAEDHVAGYAVSAISSVDPDISNTHTYTLVSGSGSADNSKFLIKGDSLTLNSALNFYVQDSMNIRLRSTDNFGCYYEQTFVIHVTHVNHPPINILLSDTTVFENQFANALVGLFKTIDPDSANTFKYSFVSGAGDSDNVSFAISGNMLNAAMKFNFEKKKLYSIRVKSTDQGGASFVKQFLIRIKDTNDPPTDILPINVVSVYENVPLGSSIVKLSTIDEDVNDLFTYSFSKVTGNDSPSFLIAGDTLKSNVIFDFHAKKLYTIYMTTTDSSGASYSDSIVIKILPTEEATLPVNNYVSPNGDGKNDFFAIVSPEVYKEYELTIYNSSGVVVYKTKEYNNEWSGSDVLPGVYYYTLLGRKEYKGSIVLVK